MSALKAHVEDGRLKLDEPTDLPERTVVPLEHGAQIDVPHELALHGAELALLRVHEAGVAAEVDELSGGLGQRNTLEAVWVELIEPALPGVVARSLHNGASVATSTGSSS